MSGSDRHDSAECREIFARLSEYLDGELSDAICLDLKEHFDDCPPCRLFLESLRRTVRWIEDGDTAPLPDDVRRRVLAARSRLG